jgi:hypothetical protein
MACKATPFFHLHYEESINFFSIEPCLRENRMSLVTCFIKFLSSTAYVHGTSKLPSKCWLSDIQWSQSGMLQTLQYKIAGFYTSL